MTTRTIYLQPTALNQFNNVQKRVMKALTIYQKHKINQFLNSEVSLKSMLQVKIDGKWSSPVISSNDFENFFINLGIGERTERSITIYETEQRSQYMMDKKTPVISFNVTHGGLSNEVLDVIGYVCAQFGETIKVNEFDEIMQSYRRVKAKSKKEFA